ncbi:phosphodiester glycosidase family protein [Paenibacillus chartarius]|uniref:Phosphodiester glycosidase family protein n=1 Tax=Paenibacillus chartarius TaxID=747481 RepID=A0ABV6DRS5_9BACL
MLYAVSFFVFFMILFSIWFFLTPWGSNLRYLMADTLITTQHRDWAKYLIGSEELQKRVDDYWKKFEDMGNEPDQRTSAVTAAAPVAKKPTAPYEVEPIEGKNFKGHLIYINDPTKLKVIVTNKVGKGEKVTSMVERTGALLGVNGGGFVDPNWEGNGFQPEGIVMSGGKVYYNDSGKNSKRNIIGIDRTGKLIAGNYSENELVGMGVQEAVSFSPRFIVNGQGQLKSAAEGWGIAPRTCIGQTKDGRIVFAVIDGRQPGHSIGATLYDIQQIFLAKDVVIAANLDGGSSTVFVKGGVNDAKPEIVNKPSSEYGERYLPTAWLLFDNPNAVFNKNIWEGLDKSKIDPSKW